MNSFRCWQTHPPSCIPRIFQSSKEDVFPMHRDWPQFAFCTITAPHYRLDFRVLDRTGRDPPRGIVRIFLWFCDKHRQGRTLPSPVSCKPAPFQSGPENKQKEEPEPRLEPEGGKLGLIGGIGAMSEKYMSIGAPMTELPVAQPRGYTSHSHR